MTEKDDLIEKARRNVALRRHNLGANLRQLQHTGRQLSRITRTGPQDSQRGVLLLADLEKARAQVAEGRRQVEVAQAELDHLLGGDAQ